MDILIPAQRFSQSKSRLSTRFSEAERSELSRSMLGRVLDAFISASPNARVHVLSNDPEVLDFSTLRGAQPAHDRPNVRGHGDQLRAFASALNEDQALLVVMSDLPLITPKDAQTILQACEDASVLTAPDRHQLGTNAAYFRDGSCRELHFGHADSFLRHEAAHAQRAGYRCFQAPAFQLDVDEPEDLDALCDFVAQRPDQDDALVRWLCGSHA